MLVLSYLRGLRGTGVQFVNAPRHIVPTFSSHNQLLTEFGNSAFVTLEINRQRFLFIFSLVDAVPLLFLHLRRQVQHLDHWSQSATKLLVERRTPLQLYGFVGRCQRLAVLECLTSGTPQAACGTCFPRACFGEGNASSLPSMVLSLGIRPSN